VGFCKWSIPSPSASPTPPTPSAVIWTSLIKRIQIHCRETWIR
jgi:hypothetical protein